MLSRCTWCQQDAHNSNCSTFKDIFDFFVGLVKGKVYEIRAFSKKLRKHRDNERHSNLVGCKFSSGHNWNLLKVCMTRI